MESVVLEGHTGSVNCADVLVIGGDRPRALIATASTDGTARIYMHATPAAAPIAAFLGTRRGWKPMELLQPLAPMGEGWAAGISQDPWETAERALASALSKTNLSSQLMSL